VHDEPAAGVERRGIRHGAAAGKLQGRDVAAEVESDTGCDDHRGRDAGHSFVVAIRVLGT
jgi:hypothetical protein